MPDTPPLTEGSESAHRLIVETKRVGRLREGVWENSSVCECGVELPWFDRSEAFVRHVVEVAALAEERATRAEAALETVLNLANEIGQAWRGDWSNFDGRTLRSELEGLRGVADGTEDAERFRLLNGLCLRGRGHWNEHCDESCRAALVPPGPPTDENQKEKPTE